MTISSTVRVAGPYSGNDATVTFSFAFKVFAAADVQVILTDSTDTESVLTLTTDYTVTLNGNQDTNPGGSVTLLVAPATGEKLTVTSDQASYQSVNLANQGGFYPEVINNQLDKLAINIQQCERDIAQAARVPLSSSIDPDIVSDALITVATSIGDVEIVAGSIGDVGTVATNIANVNLVGGDITNVNSVAGDLTNIDAVAGDLSNVDIVASDIADVSTCADNIVLIQSAPANAAAAAASAVASAASAVASAASADESEAYANLAIAANDAAEAAASASGPVLFYDTKAAANSALSGLAEGQIVEVMADESVSGLRTRYRVETGAYVFKIIIGNAVLNTASALRAIPYSAALTTAETLGVFASGDGGGRTWRWDATCTWDDNTGMVVKPTGHVGAGRWVGDLTQPVNTRWFGALGGSDSLNDEYSVYYNVENLIVGQPYIIASAGDTDFTLCGAADSVAGTAFTATAAGTGTGTVYHDAQPAIQAALNWVLRGPTVSSTRVYDTWLDKTRRRPEFSNTVIIPTGFYWVNDSIYIGPDSGLASIHVTSDIEGYYTYIRCLKTDRPSIVVQGLYYSTFRGIRVTGSLKTYIQDGINNGSWDRSVKANWLNGYSDARYAPYCGIAIDPYCGTNPGSAYPGTYGKAASSRLTFYNCASQGFAVGVALQPCNNDGNSDFISFHDCEWNYNCTGLSIGNAQARNTNRDNCSFSYCHTAIDTVTHGKQVGSGHGYTNGCVFDNSYQIFNVSSAYGGPFVFRDCYGEFMSRLGVEPGSGTGNTTIAFDGCKFSFSAGYIGYLVNNAGGNFSFQNTSLITKGICVLLKAPAALTIDQVTIGQYDTNVSWFVGTPGKVARTFTLGFWDHLNSASSYTNTDVGSVRAGYLMYGLDASYTQKSINIVNCNSMDVGELNYMPIPFWVKRIGARGYFLPKSKPVNINSWTLTSATLLTDTNEWQVVLTHSTGYGVDVRAYSPGSIVKIPSLNGGQLYYIYRMVNNGTNALTLDLHQLTDVIGTPTACTIKSGSELTTLVGQSINNVVYCAPVFYPHSVPCYLPFTYGSDKAIMKGMGQNYSNAGGSSTVTNLAVGDGVMNESLGSSMDSSIFNSYAAYIKTAGINTSTGELTLSRAVDGISLTVEYPLFIRLISNPA